MAITEEQYEDITSELDSHDFYHLGSLAWTASNSNLPRELDDLHTLSKQALDYRYDNKTHDSLEELLDETEELRCGVTDAIEALEKIDDVLSKIEEVLTNKLYAEDFKDE